MEPDGALYAGIAKRMVLTGDWINLYVNGNDWLDKPHFTFWVTALSFKLFGISAFAYKLPALLFTFSGACYTYLLGRSICNKRIGLVSSLSFLTALHLVISNFDVRAEGYLCALIIAAVYHYYRAQQESFWHVVAGSLFAAAAVMTKGMFAVIPVFSGFIIYWILTGQARQLLRARWWSALFMLLLFIVPELYALYTQFDLHPEKVVFGQNAVSGIRFFFIDSQFGRFLNTGPIRGKGDLSFFLHTTLWAFLPWSLLLCTAVFQLFKRRHREGQPREIIILWTSSAATFLLFSFSRFQLPHYIIVLFPFFAVITAIYLTSLRDRALQIFSYIQNLLFLLVILLLCAIALISGFKNNYLTVGMLMMVTLLSFIYIKGRNQLMLVARGSLLSAGIMVFLYAFFYPALLRYQAGMTAGQWLRKNHPQTTTAVFSDSNAFAFAFYAGGIPQYLPDTGALDKFLSSRPAKDKLVIYTPAASAGLLREKYGAQVLKSFDHYRITRLTGKFLNNKTRPATLEKYLLLQLN